MTGLILTESGGKAKPRKKFFNFGHFGHVTLIKMITVIYMIATKPQIKTQFAFRIYVKNISHLSRRRDDVVAPSLVFKRLNGEPISDKLLLPTYAPQFLN